MDVPTDTPEDVGNDAGPPCVGPPGLYVPGSCTELMPGVRRFEPQYELWSDGAVKERFVLLPAGTRIDTTDPDAWVFPVGTIFWKTFSRDGLRIETRINTKVSEGTGPDHWTMRTFAWSADQLSVSEVTAGVVDALGTDHDIPATTLCAQCHVEGGGAADVGLGFSAIQLNHDGSDTTLVGLFGEGFLSAEIDPLDAVVPGNTMTAAALGYLHANCGGCHGGDMAQPRPDPLIFWIDVGLTDVSFTGPYLTAVDHPSMWSGAAFRVDGGSADTSAVMLRMMSRVVGAQMPPIATERVHLEGMGAVRGWINSL